MSVSYRWVIVGVGALDLRRPRGNVLAGDLPGADVDRDRLVAGRHIERHDFSIS